MTFDTLMRMYAISRAYDHEELFGRDNVGSDLFWLRDNHLPEREVLNLSVLFGLVM